MPVKSTLKATIWQEQNRAGPFIHHLQRVRAALHQAVLGQLLHNMTLRGALSPRKRNRIISSVNVERADIDQSLLHDLTGSVHMQTVSETNLLACAQQRSTGVEMSRNEHTDCHRNNCATMGKYTAYDVMV